MSVPPGPYDRKSESPRQPSVPWRKRAWPRRHPVWSALIAIVALLFVIGAVANGAAPIRARDTAASPSPSSTIASAAEIRPLPCDALAVSRRPADHATVKIQVHTAADAWVTAIGPLALLNGESAAGRASASGTRIMRFKVGDAAPGIPVVIGVLVSHGGSTGTCWAALRPRPAPAAAVAAPAQPAASSSPPASSPPRASSAPSPPPATTASCYPLSNEGTCYEPGEYCRDDDHGVTGVAEDGETITCEDNNGWRWEPT